MSKLPTVAIVIPVRNGAARLPACLQSIRELDYPADRVEVLIADGRSTDGTRTVAEAFGARVVDNPHELVASGRNAGFAAARAEVVAFTDDDCTFDREWLRNAVTHLQEPGLAGVGGPTLVPPDESAFGKAVAYFFRLGVRFADSVHAEEVPTPRDVTDLPGCNMVYRHEALEKVMPCPETLITCEDVELGCRLRDRGYRLRSAPDVRVFHHKRPTPGRFYRQIARFAMGRMQLSRRRAEVLRPTHIVAGMAIPMALLLSPVVAPATPLVLLAIFVLALIDTRSAGVAARAAFVVPGAVAAWSWGFLREWLFPTSTDDMEFDWSRYAG